jgi:predicted acylesterase/phospholipase RssA
VLASKPELSAPAAVDHLEQLWTQRIPHNPHGDGNSVMRVRGDFRPWLDAGQWLRAPDRPLRDLAGDAAFLSIDMMKRLAHAIASPDSLDKSIMGLFDVSAFVDAEPFGRLVRETISFDAVRHSKLVLRLTATNWSTGEVREFAAHELTGELGPLAVMASAAIPGIFPPVNIDGTLYVDGGVVMNTPLRPALKADADIIHLVAVNPDLGGVSAAGTQPPNTMDLFGRTLNMVVASTITDDLDTARLINRIAGLATNSNGKPYRRVTIHRYNPRVPIGGITAMLDFDADNIRRLIADGEKEAIEHDCDKEHCVLAAEMSHTCDVTAPGMGI